MCRLPAVCCVRFPGGPGAAQLSWLQPSVRRPSVGAVHEGARFTRPVAAESMCVVSGAVLLPGIRTGTGRPVSHW